MAAPLSSQPPWHIRLDMHSTANMAPKVWGSATCPLAGHQLMDICAVSKSGLLRRMLL